MLFTQQKKTRGNNSLVISFAVGFKSFNYSRHRLSKAAGYPFIHRLSVKTSRNVSSRDSVFFNVEHSSGSDKRLFCTERKHSLVDAFRTSLTISKYSREQQSSNKWRQIRHLQQNGQILIVPTRKRWIKRNRREKALLIKSDVAPFKWKKPRLREFQRYIYIYIYIE